MIKNKFLGFAFFILTLFMAFNFQACKKKKEESELITTVIIHLYKSTVSTGNYSWKDPDGDGGDAPLLADTLKLDSGQVYTANLDFLDESSSTTKDLTSEIRQEAKNHLVCFASTPNNLTIKIKDSDGTFPIGLESEFTAVTKGHCKLRITLRHQPGVKNGTCDPGESDVDVEFPVIIK